MGALDDLEAYVASLDETQKAQLDQLIAPELASIWLPEPDNKPQCEAYWSLADLLLFGGGAGGGKTDLLAGTALTQHRRAVIFRRQAVDLRGLEDRIIEIAGREGWNGADKILRRPPCVLELGHLQKPGAELSWQGRPHDFFGFDEGAQIPRAKVQFVLGWLRSVDGSQRKRAIIASNPPTGGEGEWLIEWFAPWLDERFPNPAKQGELRWAATAPDREGTTIWLPDGSPIVFTGLKDYRPATAEEIASNDARVVQPLTRTFIQSLLDNNPYLAKTGYRAQIQSLPEPLRSQLLNGDFVVGRKDHEWQVIPTAWVKAAQARWTATPPIGAQMTAIGVDVAQGGDDSTTIAPRYGPWYAELVKRPGIETPRPSDVAGLVVTVRRHKAVVIVDVGGGYGGGVKERLEENNVDVRPFNGAAESQARTKDKQLGFRNLRAAAWWGFREALDPDQEGGSQIALPPSPTLLADLTAVRWKLSSGGIQVEDKEIIKKADRLGRSPDEGDAVVQAWAEGERAIVAKLRKAARGAAPPQTPVTVGERGAGWLGR
ncbi:MAG TPA: terminase [Xanthobacteraceae bacterium]|nr:terminase [Xanthobacteraceae bacterium]